MNDCNGNGTWVASIDKCVCKEGWKFADCSLETEILEEGFIKIFTEGPKWLSLSYEGGTDSIRLTLESNSPMDVYINRDFNSDPNNFSFEMDFL